MAWCEGRWQAGSKKSPADAGPFGFDARLLPVPEPEVVAEWPHSAVLSQLSKRQIMPAGQYPGPRTDTAVMGIGARGLALAIDAKR
jgi:hypothetical protein